MSTNESVRHKGYGSTAKVNSELLDALGSDYRTRIIRELDRHECISVDRLADILSREFGKDVNQVAIGLHHNHLPRLADYGICELYANEVRKGPRYPEVRLLLAQVE